MSDSPVVVVLTVGLIVFLVTCGIIWDRRCDAWVAEQGGQRFHARSADCAAVMPDGRVRLRP